LERLTALRAELADKILIDVSNAATDAAGGLPDSLRYPGGSLAEQLQCAWDCSAIACTRLARRDVARR
jgi:hypothetical protein